MEKPRPNTLVIEWADRFVAALFLAGGIAITVVAYGYSLGSLNRIGPGLMPFLIGIAMIVASGFALLRPGGEKAQFDGLPLFPALALIAGIIGWCLTVGRFGLLPATALLMLLSTMAYGPVRWASTTLVIAATTAACVLLFIYGLKLPFHIVRW